MGDAAALLQIKAPIPRPRFGSGMSAAAETDPSPFDLVGGEAVVRRVVDRFYDLMDQEPAYAELRALHAPDLAPMRESLSGFLTGWLGGPRDWFAAHPGVCVMSAHARIPVDRATAAQWCEAMARALADAGVDPDLAAQINTAFGRMSQGMRRDA